MGSPITYIPFIGIAVFLACVIVVGYSLAKRIDAQAEG